MWNLPLHPAVVHLPVALAVVIPLVAFGLLVATWRDLLPDRVSWIVVALQGLLVVGGFVGMRTGEQDEHQVERLVSKDLIEGHEEAAELFVYAALAVLVLMVVQRFVSQPAVRRALSVGATAGTLVIAALAFNVGHAGAELVYRHGAARAYTNSANLPAPKPTIATGDDDEDDVDD